MNNSNEEVERGWSPEESLKVPPRTRLAFECEQIRESLRDLERYEAVERGSSSSPIDKLVSIAESSIANCILTGSARGYMGKVVLADKARMLAKMMRGLARYAKENTLAAHTGNDFSEPNAVVARNVARIACIPETEAMALPDSIITRMRNLV